MEALAIVIFILGLLLIAAEAFIPGFGVCGVSGLILIVVSFAVTFIGYPFGIFVVVGALAALALFLFVFFSYIRKKQLYGKIILDETLNYEIKEVGDLEFFLGKEGITKTTLKPFGSVDFNGKTMEVYSEGGYISEKRRVKVIEVTSQKIIVKQMNQ